MNKNKITAIVALIITMVLSLFGCNKEKGLDKIISDLHSDDDSIRFDAIDNLEKYEPVLKEQILLLKEAAKTFPKAEYDWQSISGIIVESATKNQDESLIGVIDESYVHYDAIAKGEALRFLSNYSNKKSIQLYTDLLIKYPKETTYFPTGILDKDFSFKEIIFPRLMNLISVDNVKSDVLLLLLNYFDADQLDPNDYRKYIGQVIESSKYSRSVLEKEESMQTDIWDNEAYQNERARAGIYADLLGHFSDDQVISELKEYFLLHDCKLKMFAVISLLKLNQSVDKDILNTIAADAESRKWFYDNLVMLRKENLFPPKFKTQEAFAESDMINWLIYPTELGRTPDAIELMKVVEVDSHGEDGIVEFYLYKFKSDHVDWKDDGWMSGVSGYFPKKDKPSTTVYGYTFSAFEPWDNKTPDEHVKYIQELISKAVEK